jgi:hypothetical protein
MFLHKNICYNDEINERIYNRTNSDFEGRNHFLFDPRPTQTKQSVFLLPKHNFIENQIRENDKFAENEYYVNDNLKKIFPDVCKETILRNQTVALQHGAEEGVYVPSLKSDLYFSNPIKKEENNNNLNLRKNTDNKTTVQYKSNTIGSNIFSNNTRIQLRNNWNF